MATQSNPPGGGPPAPARSGHGAASVIPHLRENEVSAPPAGMEEPPLKEAATEATSSDRVPSEGANAQGEPPATEPGASEESEEP